jgi:hypothetical protein
MRVDECSEARVGMRVFSTLIPRSNENKSWMRVDWVYRGRCENSSKFEPVVESA